MLPGFLTQTFSETIKILSSESGIDKPQLVSDQLTLHHLTSKLSLPEIANEIFYAEQGLRR